MKAAEPAEAGHAGPIADLSGVCFPARTEQWGKVRVRAHLEAPAGRGWVIPAEGDGIDGYLLALSAGDKGDILSLAVAQDARGQGMATNLVRTCIQALRKEGRETMLAEVRASNGPARNLYEGCGMQIIFTRAAYYSGADGSGHEGGLLYARDL